MNDGQIQCKKCVMDRSASEITFDHNGICNFCHEAQREIRMSNLSAPNLGIVIKSIKDKGQKYDCLIGLSGGVDSSYLLHKAIELGLRPLCFSVDNGWNNPKADENIMRLVEALKVPFFRYTINLANFAKLQTAFVGAGLRNIEIPTDHVLMATTYEVAAENGIKYILSGGNIATESIMPASWGDSARDLVHIKDVYKKMTGEKLSGLPVCSLLKWNYYRWIKGIRIIYLLDYVEFNRNEAAALLTRGYGFQEYGEKHCENRFTAWFQNYYLFEKFGIEKRKAHLSSLINSGQMTRAEALEELGRDHYFEPIGLEERIKQYPKREHSEFKHDHYDLIAKIIRLWKF